MRDVRFFQTNTTAELNFKIKNIKIAIKIIEDELKKRLKNYEQYQREYKETKDELSTILTNNQTKQKLERKLKRLENKLNVYRTEFLPGLEKDLQKHKNDLNSILAEQEKHIISISPAA